MLIPVDSTDIFIHQLAQRAIRGKGQCDRGVSIQIKNIDSSFGCNPQPTEVIFTNLVNKVILQTYRLGLRAIVQKLIAVVTSYPVMRGNPNVSFGVFKNITDKAIGKPCILRNKLKVVLAEKTLCALRKKQQSLHYKDKEQQETRTAS